MFVIDIVGNGMHNKQPQEMYWTCNFISIWQFPKTPCSKYLLIRVFVRNLPKMLLVDAYPSGREEYNVSVQSQKKLILRECNKTEVECLYLKDNWAWFLTTKSPKSD